MDLYAVMDPFKKPLGVSTRYSMTSLHVRPKSFEILSHSSSPKEKGSGSFSPLESKFRDVMLFISSLEFFEVNERSHFDGVSSVSCSSHSLASSIASQYARSSCLHESSYVMREGVYKRRV